jgi:hypothetical protein
MPLIVRAFPVLQGKEEDIRKLAAEMAGPRREEAQEFYRSFGVVRESWHYQETPHGPLVIGVTELDDDPRVRAQQYAESDRPFDSWFKTQVRNLTGIDPNTQPLGPPSEEIFDTQGEPLVQHQSEATASVSD